MEKLFHLKENGTNVKTEVMAGITTFLAMAYILAVNPSMLGDAGMNSQGVFMATALAAAVATIVMALLANYPIALASGMGLNAYFAYTVVIKMGYSWQMALAAVFVEGVIFILLSLTNVREAIFNAIPLPLKHAVSAGIGLFIAFIGLQNCKLVVEAAIEKAELKKELFAALDKAAGPDTILASNTSSISLTEIASATGRADKVIGMHFFNPAPVMKLVEVIKGYSTSQDTIDAIMAVVEKMGKISVLALDKAGFIVNRALDPMLNEAIFMLEEGVGTVEDIDNAMKYGCNHPMGPLALTDLIGLDVILAVMEVLYREYGDSKYRPAPLLRKMVRAGKLGKKTGEGFYKY